MAKRTMIEALFAHNDWAHGQVLNAASSLDDEALDRPFEIGPGSLRATLYHLWAAERIWLNRWLGKPNGGALDKKPTWSIGELRQHLRETAGQRNGYVADLGEGGLSKTITYVGPQKDTYTQPVGELMMHVCNHAVHHRAQALNMLRHLGAETPMLDYLKMLLEPSPPAPPAFDVARLKRCFAYGDWAMARVMSAAESLNDDVLDGPVEMGVGSLRKTLLHIHDAEASWLKIWLDPERTSFEELPIGTSLATLRDRTSETIAERDRFLNQTDPAGLQRIVAIKPRPDMDCRFTIGDTMLQLFGHGTHHRAQAVNLLRHAGVAPPRVDYVIWVRDGN